MKNWGWLVALVLVVCVLIWTKWGWKVTGPTVNCLYGDADKKAETICVYGIKDGAFVESPLQISGRARGTWFFEASFPVQILDHNQQSLVETFATAQGNWMTEELVPFTSEIKFTAPAGDTGTLVLKKDNPSGLPEHDASFSIPIRFR